MALPTRKLTIISVNDTNQKLFFKFFSRLTFIFFLVPLFELNAQIIIKEKVEINPQRTIQPENGIGGDNRNPCYIRYGGEVVLRSIYQTNQSLELWEENLGKIIPDSEIQLGSFPQWHKFIFYLLNTTTGQKYYPEFGDIINSYSTIDFYPSHIPGEPLPWNPEDWWEIEIERDYSLAAMPPPEILNHENITNPFQPAGEIPVPLPGSIYAITRNAATQDDALWIDKPATQLIMDELGSHIDDTLFFGQMNVGDTLRFFLRSPNSVVNGMNLYPQITPAEQIMPDGKILICKLEFEDWTDLLFDDVSIEIYLQPDSGAYAGPIAIFFEPGQIGPNDTTTITFKYRHLDGTFGDIDPSRTFEVGLIDGCTLGILKTETDSGVYIDNAYQPMYFIADSSADSGTVMVRAGLIDEGGGASKMISGNLEQDATAETNTAKRYDIFINKNTPVAFSDKREDNTPLGDNPGSEFCQLEYYTQDFGVGSLELGDECEDWLCQPTFRNFKGNIEIREVKQNYNDINYCSYSLAHVYPPAAGIFKPLFDSEFANSISEKIKGQLLVNYSLDVCYDGNKNYWKYQITEEAFFLRAILDVCEETILSGSAEFILHDQSELSIIPNSEVCLALEDFEDQRLYGGGGKYYLIAPAWAHEKVHKAKFEKLISTVLNMKREYFGKKYRYKDLLSQVFQPECNITTNDEYKTIYQIKTYLDKILKLFVSDLHELYTIAVDEKDNETKTHSHNDVQWKIRQYKLALQNSRSEEYWINCPYKELE